MIPENKLSTEYVEGLILSPDNKPYRPFHSYEMGGIAIQDPSQGLMVQEWHCYYDKPTERVMLEAPSIEGAPIELFKKADITHVSIAFDQNMRWVCAYSIKNAPPEFRWYDSQVAGYVTTVLDANIQYPFLSMDDKRRTQLPVSDIILTYLKPSHVYPGRKVLFCRAQRDRYTIEYFLADALLGEIYNFGMANKLRLQWDIFDFDSVADIFSE